MKEEDILHENRSYWVGRNSDDYTVYKNGCTHAESICSFTKDESGLSIAIAYCDYFAAQEGVDYKSWVYVPKEPTRAMKEAGNSWSGLPSATWSDMIDAAPECDEDQLSAFLQQAYEDGFRDGRNFSEDKSE